MIGAFARMLGKGNRVLNVEETSEGYRVRALDASAANEGKDGPPEGFVEKIPHEGGDVFLAPIVEALRNVLRNAKKDASVVPATPGPEEEAASA